MQQKMNAKESRKTAKLARPWALRTKSDRISDLSDEELVDVSSPAFFVASLSPALITCTQPPDTLYMLGCY